MPINTNKAAETHTAWHSLALIFSMTRGTEAGYPKVEQNNNKKVNLEKITSVATKPKGWIVQNASFRMKHQHVGPLFKICTELLNSQKKCSAHHEPPKGHRWIIKKLHLAVWAEPPMHAGRPSSLHRLISWYLKTNCNSKDQHDSLSSVYYSKSGTGKPTLQTHCVDTSGCLHNCCGRGWERQKTQESTPTCARGGRKQTEENVKLFFLTGSNKQLEERVMIRERPQRAAWERPTFTNLLRC